MVRSGDFRKGWHALPAPNSLVWSDLCELGFRGRYQDESWGSNGGYPARSVARLGPPEHNSADQPFRRSRSLAGERPCLRGCFLLDRKEHVLQEACRCLCSSLHHLRQPPEDANSLVPHQIVPTGRRAQTSHPGLFQRRIRQPSEGSHGHDAGWFPAALFQRSGHCRDRVQALLSMRGTLFVSKCQEPVSTNQAR